MPILLRDPRLVLMYAATLTVLGAFVALYTSLQLEGPAGIAGDPSALLTLRATALPAIAAIPFVTPYLTRFSPARRAAVMLGAAAVIETVGLLAGPARATAVSLFTFFLFTGASLGPVAASAAAPYGFAALMCGVAGVLALGGGLVLIASRGRGIR